LIILLIYLFIALGVSAEGYFCPSLTLIADGLGLSQNVAGVTFLALGNGAPDLFSSFSAISQEAPELSLGAILGAGIFVNTVVVGSIAILTSFKLTRRPFLRDIIFYMLAVSSVCIMVSDKVIHGWEAGLLVIWYIIYVTTVIIGRRVNQMLKKKGIDSAFRPSILGEEEPLLREKTPNGYQPVNFSINEEKGQPINQQSLNGHSPSKPSNIPINVNVSNLQNDNINPRRSSKDLSQSFKTGQMSESSPNLKSQNSLSVAALALSTPGTLPTGSLPKSGSMISATNMKPTDNHQGRGDESTAAANSEVSDDNADKISKRSRSFSLESSFRYSSESASLLLGGKKEDANSIYVPRANKRQSTRSFHARSPSEFNMVIIDSIVLTPALKARIAEGFGYSGVRFPGFLPIEDEERKSPSRRFLELLFPIFSDWNERTVIQKIFAILCVPLHFVFAITVPHFEYISSDDERLNGYFFWWSKHLLAINFLVDPLFICWNVGAYGNEWNGFSVSYFCILVGIVAAPLSLLFTHTEHPPKYFLIMAPVCFVTSVFWIYFLAGELVALLEVIGNVFGVSEALLGLTVLAWGNSIGDLVSNTTLARLGFANMGVSACFGSPLLNLLIGFGLSATYHILSTGESISIGFPSNLIFTFSVLLFVLLSHACFIPFRGFKAGKYYGIYLLVIFVFFTTMNILIEFLDLF